MAAHRDRHLILLRLGGACDLQERQSVTPTNQQARAQGRARAEVRRLVSGASALGQRQRVQGSLQQDHGRPESPAHPNPRAGRPQTNGHVEALHKTILDECWRPAFARYLYPRYTGLRRELDTYLRFYNKRPYPPRPPHPRTHPHRHRLPCQKDGGKMSHTCRHNSEAAQVSTWSTSSTCPQRT